MTYAAPRRTAHAIAAAALAAALTCTAAPGPAHAQSAAGELLTGSSRGSSTAPEHPNPESLDVPAPPALGSAYTGSAPLTIAIALALTAGAGLLVVEATPPLREARDQLAAQGAQALATMRNLPLPPVALPRTA